MEALARELGVGFTFDPAVNAAIDGSLRPLEVRLEPEEVLALESGDPRRRAEWGRLLREAPRGDGESLYRCGGGITAFAVDAAGMLRICPLSRREGYDLRRGTFREGWDGPLREVRSRKRERSGGCGSCRLQPLCGMCPAIGDLEAGDPESPLDFFCRVGYGRARIALEP
jgi:radical SAM protein with 4Fe4S-binding SPASM domain